MRSLSLLVLIFVLAVSANAQGLPKDANGKITYAEKIRLDSAGADELYRRAKTWVLENFKNLGQVMQKDDAQNHLIILNGKGECYAEKSFGDTIENGAHSYILRIELEDGGYIYKLSDFKTTDKWKGELPSEEVKYGKKQMLLHEQSISELAATLTKSLKLAMDFKIVVGKE